MQKNWERGVFKNGSIGIRMRGDAERIYEFVKGIFADYYKIGTCEGNREERTIGGILCRVH